MQLRRITTQGNWIPEVDGLRFAAIAATLLVHILDETFNRGGFKVTDSVQSTVYYLTEIGGRGVLLFFAISGFILPSLFCGSIYKAASLFQSAVISSDV